MKKKAIAELEFLDWLKIKLPEVYQQAQVEVSKAGGDAFLWFLREGGVSREADFVAKIGERTIDFEFQYADKIDLPFFDFKVSKVGKKLGGKRVAYLRKQFVYVVKPTLQYAIFDCKWIMQAGEYGMVPAWRSYAYRVPKEKFEAILQRDESLFDTVKMVDIKNDFLNFQFQLLDIWKDKFCYLLQSVIDEDRIVKIIPRDLDSFFRVVFILDNLQKIPQNASLWLIYLLSYINNKLDSGSLAKVVYCIDFLYSKIKLKENELKELSSRIRELMDYIHAVEQTDGTYKSSIEISPLEEIRNVLFSINLLEDMIQDMLYYYDSALFKPVQKIFENVSYPEQTYRIMQQSRATN
jgi:hypothetical protein